MTVETDRPSIKNKLTNRYRRKKVELQDTNTGSNNTSYVEHSKKWKPGKHEENWEIGFNWNNTFLEETEETERQEHNKKAKWLVNMKNE